MKISSFTICTPDHLPQALVAIRSIQNNTNTAIDYYIFILTDNDSVINNINTDITINIFNRFYNDVFDKYYNSIIKKYGNKSNQTRWSLKPVVLNYLLQKYDKCIYIDPDIFFVDDIKILCDSIDHNIILTPHFRIMNDPNFDICNITDGYFNAGFIGCSNNINCQNIMYWWANRCISNCMIDKCRGLWDDQRYLDLIYIHFDEYVLKLNHKGCNIAEWNINNYHITLIDQQNGLFIIDNKYKPIFFHFRTYEKNPILKYYLNKYTNLALEISKDIRPNLKEIL